jgi:hypothetical protein
MSSGDLLIAIIIIGVGLSVAYIRAEYQLHVRHKTVERQTGGTLHEPHSFRKRIERNGMPVHVRIARAPAQSQNAHTVRFLRHGLREEREHRLT